jgi:predicted nucleic acid-binding protein
MKYLLDTNILLRLLDENSSQHGIVSDAIKVLFEQQHKLMLCPQALAEFWAVATRPVNANGLGYTTAVAREAIDFFRGRFGMVFEHANALEIWLELVTEHQVSGKPTHDTKLVALMLIHGIEHVLTINTTDFKRFTEIKAVHPQEISA